MMALINWFSQVGSVTKLSLLTIVQRKGASAAAVVGIAGVVGVLLGVLSIAQGFRRAMTVAGDPNTAMILRNGADTEMMSILEGPDTRTIADAPGIAKWELGPLASAELFTVIDLPKRSTGTDANVPLRGVQHAAFAVRQGFRLIQGRRFEPGRNEVIVGTGAAREFAGCDLGGQIKVGRNVWTVVGIFTDGGGISESEIWADATVLQGAYDRGNTFQAVYAKLAKGQSFEQFKDTLTTDPRLKVKVVRQTDYYAEQSTVVYRLITGLGTLVASLMGLGAVFGAWNTMYTAVSARTREIATLRAMGFGGGTVVVSVLLESLALALMGGTLGAGIAYLAFDGFQAATINWQSFSQVTFAFAVTPQLLVEGVVYAALIGLLGGLFPAIRAARLPVATALREL